MIYTQRGKIHVLVEEKVIQKQKDKEFSKTFDAFRFSVRVVFRIESMHIGYKHINIETKRVSFVRYKIKYVNE